jgi:GT2 family glycosyltransferase
VEDRELSRLMPLAEATLTVIVPVFNAPLELDQCLNSLVTHTPLGVEILIIDDASPNRETAAVLAAWKAKTLSGWRFLANPINRGFVATANRGMQTCSNDVVLLNSDTEVTPGWLGGIQRCLASDSRIATATPWTNNGEIASLPEFCRVNPVPADVSQVAKVIANAGRPKYPELPTAVGFCMAITRHAMDRVGFFDEAVFGKGYGEENDFSQRVFQAGMRNVLCDDVYVVHLGGRSFGPTGLKPDESSMQRLLSKHPDYLEKVQAFIGADPLSARRDEILLALDRAAVPMG